MKLGTLGFQVPRAIAVRSSPRRSEHRNGLLVEFGNILLELAEDKVAAILGPAGVLVSLHILHVSVVSEDNATIVC